MLTYATLEIEAFMNLPENLPEFAVQARKHICDIHRKYAPSNLYDTQTFNHIKELDVRRVFAEKAEKEALRASVNTDETVLWSSFQD